MTCKFNKPFLLNSNKNHRFCHYSHPGYWKMDLESKKLRPDASKKVTRDFG
jgi:hypothetical protein